MSEIVIKQENAQRLKGEIAIITGGTGGIGQGIARRFVENGAAVVINYIGKEKEVAEAFVEEIKEAGGRAIAVEADVANEDQVNEMVKTTIDTFGDLTILVNNAGITIDATIRNQKLESWNKVLGVNLTGPFLTMRAALTHMIPRKKGRVINISSLAGMIGNPGACPYSASKAGLIGLTKAVAKEVAKKNITVNVICPSLVFTPMTGETPQNILDGFMAQIPVNRFSQPEEVGDLCVYLGSEESGFITGNVVRFDGGMGM